MALQLQFDARQEYQLQAVESVVRLFEGLPRTEAGGVLGDEIAPNLSPNEDIYEGLLLDNLNAVQEEAGIEPSTALEMEQGLVLDGAGYEVHRSPHFTVEMETGTGKTYVYLRTIYELRKRFGWGKFIIVVPSVAIYEGVCKNFDITREHFRALYGNEVVNLIRYDGAQLSRLRTFATSTFCEVMVMTLDSFNKISNVIYKSTEKLPGERKPFQFIQETRPVMILDEPQNMGSDKSKQALRTLHPLVTLRFSATHRESPNLVYRLTPFDAFRLSLVKKIEVLGVTERENVNQTEDTPLLALQSVTGSGSAMRAQVLVFARGTSGTKETTLTLRRGDDLGAKTKRNEYANYVVEEISLVGGTPSVEFSNGISLGLGGLGLSRPELFRVQIEKTVEQHLRRQEELRERGIKVLSLFFIDRVANFTAPDGLIRLLFDEAFDKAKKSYPQWKKMRAEDVRSAYFAQKKVRAGDASSEAIDTEARNTEEREAEKAAFQLIMRDKEKLLSLDEPVSFLFAHSALREGWDNPNVFQICTLNQTVSVMRKRQEIGRGLRLCVDQSGNRVAADDVNILTVVANSAYKDYADGLQSEYVEDGHSEGVPIKDVRAGNAKRNDVVFKSKEFRTLWSKLCQPTEYSFNLDTDSLVEECANRLNGKTFTAPVIVVERGKFIQTRLSLQLERILPNGNAKVRVTVEDTQGDEREVAVTVKEGDNLKAKTGEDRLRDFRVVTISGSGDAATVTFGNTIELTPHYVYRTDGADGFKPNERLQMAPREAFPVPNLMARAARETGLTRPTINLIFKALRPEKAEFLLRNPEGFISTFIAEVNNALADHIAERITFSSGGSGGNDEERLESLFPATKKFMARELREAGPKGMYDQVQTDSGVEISFVELLRDDSQLVFYFKFPPAFKVSLPKQIGNYNPDWGLGRISESGVSLQYIRETKGSEDISKLQWSHEKRKIECARKYFASLDLDYRPVTGKVADWWQPWQSAGKL